MKIEAVIVCKDYSDFLEHTLPDNIQQLDKVVVVTHPNDHQTKKLCNQYGVDYVETEIFHERGDKFNKARGINLGLSHLRQDGWVLHLDADILLPHGFKRTLYKAHLDEKKLYGADRLNCISYENWMKHKHKLSPQYQWRYLVNAPAEFPLGSRLLHAEYGYCPIGFFQLWHGSTRRKYPCAQGSCEHDDVLFAVQWRRDQRQLLSELLVIHLESENNIPGANWEGRKTKKFGPHHHHPKHHPQHPYCEGWKIKEPGKS